MSMGKHSCGGKLRNEIRGAQSGTGRRSSARKELGRGAPRRCGRKGGAGPDSGNRAGTIHPAAGQLVGQPSWKWRLWEGIGGAKALKTGLGRAELSWSLCRSVSAAPAHTACSSSILHPFPFLMPLTEHAQSGWAGQDEQERRGNVGPSSHLAHLEGQCSRAHGDCDCSGKGGMVSRTPWVSFQLTFNSLGETPFDRDWKPRLGAGHQTPRESSPRCQPASLWGSAGCTFPLSRQGARASWLALRDGTWDMSWVPPLRLLLL